MPTDTLPEPAVPSDAASMPGHIKKDFEIVDFLKAEVDKSGELYLRVALWKVLLRIPQHCDDLLSPNDEKSRETTKCALSGMIHYSEEIISAGAEEGGLDQKKHGATESVVRENIRWLRQKMAILETKVTEPRKKYILGLFDAGES